MRQYMFLLANGFASFPILRVTHNIPLVEIFCVSRNDHIFAVVSPQMADDHDDHAVGRLIESDGHLVSNIPLESVSIDPFIERFESVTVTQSQMFLNFSESQFNETCFDNSVLSVPFIDIDRRRFVRGSFHLDSDDWNEIDLIELETDTITLPRHVAYQLMNHLTRFGALPDDLLFPTRFVDCPLEAIDTLPITVLALYNETQLAGSLIIDTPITHIPEDDYCVVGFGISNNGSVPLSFAPLTIPDTNIRFTESTISLCDDIR